MSGNERHTVPNHRRRPNRLVVALALAGSAAVLSLGAVAAAEGGESNKETSLARGSVTPEAWGARIDYRSFSQSEPGGIAPEAWGALIDYESLAAVAR